MEAELSSRMAAMATGAIPKIEASIANKKGKIDLATAESWVIRHELVSLFQDAMANGLNINDLSYPEGFGGPPDLLRALARLFNEHFNPLSPVLPNHIVATTGASLCLDALMFSICEPGDIVLVMAPYFNGLDLHLALRSGCKLVPISATMSIEGANADCQSLWKSVNTNLNEAYEGCADPSKVKALVITNPNNPLGMCYPEEVMRETMFWCGERGIYYVSDEVYALSDFSRGRGQGPTEGGLPKYDLTVTKATPFISALSVDLHDEQAGRNDLSGDAETKMRKTPPDWRRLEYIQRPGFQRTPAGRLREAPSRGLFRILVIKMSIDGVSRSPDNASSPEYHVEAHHGPAGLASAPRTSVP
ncbi:hypothetical protein PG987_008192 [Apiospora arundinis]